MSFPVRVDGQCVASRETPWAVGSTNGVLLRQYPTLGKPSLLSLSSGPSCPGCSLDLPRVAGFQLWKPGKRVQRLDTSPLGRGTPRGTQLLGSSFAGCRALGELRVSGWGPSVRAIVEVPICSGEDLAGAGLRLLRWWRGEQNDCHPDSRSLPPAPKRASRPAHLPFKPIQ